MDATSENEVSKTISWVFSFPGEDLAWIEWAGWKETDGKILLCIGATQPLTSDILEMLQVRYTEIMAALPWTYSYGDMIVYGRNTKVCHELHMVVMFKGHQS